VSPPLPPVSPTEEPQVQVWYSGDSQGQYYKVAPGVQVEQVQQEAGGNVLTVWSNKNKISFTPGHWQPKQEPTTGSAAKKS
jgi:hypothetical protein